MHSTNKAFERYFSMQSDDLRSIYEDTGKVIKLDRGLKLREDTEK
jgi:cation transport regulator ChaC